MQQPSKSSPPTTRRPPSNGLSIATQPDQLAKKEWSPNSPLTKHQPAVEEHPRLVAFANASLGPIPTDDSAAYNTGTSFDDLASTQELFPTRTIEREIFTASTFNADKFLSSRRHLELEELKIVLGGHLKELKNELVELINRDYADFINLSTNLKGVDKSLEELRKPLENMRSEVMAIRESLELTINTLSSKLSYRSDIREKKATIQLLLNIHESVTKVEDLLLINSDTAVPIESQSQGEYISAGKRIERVAIEYNQMQYLVNRGKDLPFVSNIEWRIGRIKEALQTNLSQALRSALSELGSNHADHATKEALTQCLRTYALIDQTKAAEQVIRENLVAPFTEKTITSTVLTPSLQSASATPTPIITISALTATSSQATVTLLTLLYSKILGFISKDCFLLLDITSRVLKGTNYEILVNCIFVEVVTALENQCGSIFGVSRTDVFHQNYMISMDFISQLESHCSSQKSLLHLRGHPAYLEFSKRWQLPVYFQLRFKEIAIKVEDVLLTTSITIPELEDNLPSPSTASDTDGALILPSTRMTLEAIDTCWSDDVFLYALGHRFWKLTLQLLKRYKLWLDAVVEQLADSGVGRDGEKKFTAAAAGSSASAPPAETALPPTIPDEAILRQLVVVVYDVENLVDKVRQRYYGIITPKLPEAMQDEPVLEESITTLLTTLTSPLSNLHLRITTVLTRRCAEQFAHVSEITRSYRHMNKKAPTEHSNFVPNLLRPFQMFVDANQRFVTEERWREWGAGRGGVGEIVTRRYAAVIKELLTTLKQTEDSLRKLKKKSRPTGHLSALGAAGSADDMSDEDKIRLQVLLDVRQFGAELATLGIDKDRFEPYLHLYKVVEQYEPMLKT